jgi:hypothetical protein
MCGRGQVASLDDIVNVSFETDWESGTTLFISTLRRHHAGKRHSQAGKASLLTGRTWLVCWQVRLVGGPRAEEIKGGVSHTRKTSSGDLHTLCNPAGPHYNYCPTLKIGLRPKHYDSVLTSYSSISLNLAKMLSAAKETSTKYTPFRMKPY